MAVRSSDYNARKQKALQRFGTRNPRCVVCGEEDWIVLELHHVAGRKFNDEMVILCANCHRKASDLQKDHPLIHDDPPNPAECRGRLLLGLADLNTLLSECLNREGRDLIQEGQTHFEKEKDNDTSITN